MCFIEHMREDRNEVPKGIFLSALFLRDMIGGGELDSWESNEAIRYSLMIILLLGKGASKPPDRDGAHRQPAQMFHSPSRRPNEPLPVVKMDSATLACDQFNNLRGIWPLTQPRRDSYDRH